MHKLIRIVIDASKGQSKRLSEKFKKLTSYLIDKGFLVSYILDEPLTIKKLEQFHLLIIVTPIGLKYKPYEIRALKAYINNGGALLALLKGGGDEKLATNMSSILSHFEINILDTTVIDPENNMYGDPSIVKAQASENPPNSGFLPKAVFWKATSFAVLPNQVLYSSTDSAIGGMQAMAVTGMETQGKVIAFGSSEIFSDNPPGLMQNEHIQILELYLNWLLNIRSKTSSETTNKIPDLKKIDYQQDLSLEETTEKIVEDILDDVNIEEISNKLSEDEFNTEENVIKILRMFLARAVAESNALQEKHILNKTQTVEGMDQLTMMVYGISKSIDNLTLKLKEILEPYIRNQKRIDTTLTKLLTKLSHK